MGRFLKLRLHDSTRTPKRGLKMHTASWEPLTEATERRRTFCWSVNSRCPQEGSVAISE